MEPERSKALLFYQLARFVVWGQQHGDILAADPEYQNLLGEAASVLAHAGTLIQSAEA